MHVTTSLPPPQTSSCHANTPRPPAGKLLHMPGKETGLDPRESILLSGERLHSPPLFARLERLEDRNRYLDAYALWQTIPLNLELLDGLSVPELVLCGRIARHLGSRRWGRILARQAARKDPSHPLVHLLFWDSPRTRRSRFECLLECEKRPTLDSGCGAIDTLWDTTCAYLWGSVRDFSRAHTALDQALARGVQRMWIETTRAQVLAQEDRWSDALHSAERAWTSCPGHPATAQAMAGALKMLYGDAAVSRFLFAAARSSQSFEIDLLALSHTIQWVEHLREEPDSEGSRNAQDIVILLDEAQTLADGLEARAPLADVRCRSEILRAQVSLARQRGEWDRAFELARRHSTRWVELLTRDQNTAKIHTIPCVPLRQKHDTCLPASVSMALGAQGISLDVDTLARDITYGGTSITALRAWARREGYCFVAFTVDESSTKALLEAEIPFVLLLQGQREGHAVTVVGLDLATGCLRVNDPATGTQRGIDLSLLTRLEAPTGALGIVLAPESQRSQLASLRLLETGVRSLQLDLFDALEEGHITEAEARLEALRELSSTHPIVCICEARILGIRGDIPSALQHLSTLAEAHPAAYGLFNEVLQCVQDVQPDPALHLMETLMRRWVPELTADQLALAGPNHATRYASQLAQSADTQSGDPLERAEEILHRVIATSPDFAPAYATLGSLFLRQDRLEPARLAHRIAACLQPHSEAMTELYLSTLAPAGRAEGKLKWLRERYARLEDLNQSWRAGMTLVDALCDAGRPAEGLSLLYALLAKHPDEGALAASAAMTLVFLGELEGVPALLEKADAGAPLHARMAAWLAYNRCARPRHEVLEVTHQWHSLDPSNVGVVQLWLQEVVHAQGANEARNILETLRKSLSTHPEFARMELSLLERGTESERGEQILRAWIQRSPTDASPVLELANRLLSRAQEQGGSERPALLKEVESLIESLHRLMPDDGRVSYLEGVHAELAGEPVKAREAFRRALDVRPAGLEALERLIPLLEENPDSLPSLVECSLWAALQAGEGAEVDAEKVFAYAVQTLGVRRARALIKRWWHEAPEVPTRLRAWLGSLDLDTPEHELEQARPVVLNCLICFPGFGAVRLEWIQVLIKAKLYGEAEAQARAWLKRAPANLDALGILAVILFHLARYEEAKQVLEDAIRLDPRTLAQWERLVSLHLERGNPDEAEALLEQAVVQQPDLVALWALYVKVLHIQEKWHKSLETARTWAAQQPEDSQVLTTLISILSCTDRPELRAYAETLWPRLLATSSAQPNLLESYVRHLVSAGEVQEALETLDARPHLLQLSPALKVTRLWLLRQLGRDTGTVASLCRLLEQHPDLIRGWAALLDWAQEEGGDEGQQTLIQMSPHRIHHAGFHIQRLTLLQRGGLPAEQLEPLWRRVVVAFPEQVEVAAERYEFLLQYHSAECARAWLEEVSHWAPDHALAKLLELEKMLESDEIDVAIRQFAPLWLDPETPAIAVVAGWVWLEKRHTIAPVHAGIFDALKKAKAIHLEAVSRLISYCIEEHQVEGLSTLLQALMENPAYPSQMVQRCCDALCGSGQAERALKCMEPHRLRCRQDLRLWQVYGQALCRAHRWSAAVAWLGDWRKRPEFSSLTLVLYGEACQASGAWLESLASGREVLELIGRQRSAPGAPASGGSKGLEYQLARQVLEACLHECLYGELTQLLRLCAPHLKGSDAGAALEVVARCFEQLSQSPSTSECKRLDKDFRAFYACLDAPPAWLQDRWVEALATYSPPSAWRVPARFSQPSRWSTFVQALKDKWRRVRQ